MENTKETLIERQKPFYVGAIDIGTNSIHLLIASIDPLLNTFTIDLAEKSTTRLGERDPDTGDLTAAAIERSLEALKQFKELAESYRVKDIVSVATSAVREASNGREFVEQVKTQIGLNIDLVSGAEEARLIYLGVLSGMQFGETPHFLIDIGGGSTELILADGKEASALTSSRVGAVRLQRDFIREEPIPILRREFLKTFIQGSMEPAVEKVKSRCLTDKKPVMVATSGTSMAIGSLVASEESNPPLKLHGYKIAITQIDIWVEKLLNMKPEERKKLSSISDRRSEIIVPGALILQTAMRMLGVKDLILSERALREGIIFDWMFRHGLLKDSFSFQSSIRERTVLHQAQRFSVDTLYAARVANHSINLFDKSQGILHNNDGTGRGLLWAAAMLHTCGQHINRSGYHKHSWYLIRHGDLLGYSQSEHLIIASIARYHRRSLPKKRHDSWMSLANAKDKQTVLEMSLILRIASIINKRPEPFIDSFSLKLEGQKVIFTLSAKYPDQNLSLEKWSLLNCGFIIKETTGLELEVYTNNEN